VRTVVDPWLVIDQQFSAVRAHVGSAKVSSPCPVGSLRVAAALWHKRWVLPLTCVFVDTRLMRLAGASQVVETFQRHQGSDLIHVLAADKYFDKLEGVFYPEDKRRLIG